MNLTPIQVQVQGAVLREQTVCLLNTRSKERPIILERVVIARQSLQGARIALALKTGAVTLLRSFRAQRAARLLLTRIERRVNVNHGERTIGQLTQILQVICLYQQRGALRIENRRIRAGRLSGRGGRGGRRGC